MHTETLLAPRPRKNTFLEPMRFMFLDDHHIYNSLKQSYKFNAGVNTLSISTPHFSDLTNILYNLSSHQNFSTCEFRSTENCSWPEFEMVLSDWLEYDGNEICNGCTDDVQRLPSLAKEEFLHQQLQSEMNQYDSSASCVNQKVIFPLQQERVASPIFRTQNPIPHNSSFMVHNLRHNHVTTHKCVLSPEMRNHTNKSPLTKFGFTTSSRRHSI